MESDLMCHLLLLYTTIMVFITTTATMWCVVVSNWSNCCSFSMDGGGHQFLRIDLGPAGYMRYRARGCPNHIFTRISGEKFQNKSMHTIINCLSVINMIRRLFSCHQKKLGCNNNLFHLLPFYNFFLMIRTLYFYCRFEDTRVKLSFDGHS